MTGTSHSIVGNISISSSPVGVLVQVANALWCPRHDVDESILGTPFRLRRLNHQRSLKPNQLHRLALCPLKARGKAATARIGWCQAEKGQQGHLAVGTLGHLLEFHFIPANNRDRAQVVKLPDAKRGFVLLPRRWVV